MSVTDILDSGALPIDGLPPLKSIEAFITISQLGSFRDAAHRLGLSVSTLSRRVKTLEAHLGESLLVRNKTPVCLTAAGQNYYQTAEKALEVLAAGRAAASRADREPLALTVGTHFAKRFMVDKLAEFESRFPHIALTIDTNPLLDDMRTKQFDIAIRYGMPDDWPGIETAPVFIAAGGPACAVHLKSIESDPPACIEALANHTLLHPGVTPNAWARFFEASGNEGVQGAADRYFDDPDLLYSAAERGLGFVLVDPVFQRSLLETGRLIMPMDIEVATGDGFYFAFAPGASARAAVREFCDWLLSLEAIQALRTRQKRFGY